VLQVEAGFGREGLGKVVGEYALRFISHIWIYSGIEHFIPPGN